MWIRSISLPWSSPSSAACSPPFFAYHHLLVSSGAGFAISALGLDSIPFVDNMAELGVATLLFTIGLKLNPRDIASPRVVGTATGQAVGHTSIFVAVFCLALLVPLRELTGVTPLAWGIWA
ncbi:hypothetical protein QVA66_08760 [Staphylococcus chromogenes]|nr:hypothetical protein [Staphylococcus chromogenes]